MISASRLIAIPKKNGDVRPIAICEVLGSLAAEAICSELRTKEVLDKTNERISLKTISTDEVTGKHG